MKKKNEKNHSESLFYIDIVYCLVLWLFFSFVRQCAHTNQQHQQQQEQEGIMFSMIISSFVLREFLLWVVVSWKARAKQEQGRFEIINETSSMIALIFSINVRLVPMPPRQIFSKPYERKQGRAEQALHVKPFLCHAPAFLWMKEFFWCKDTLP